MGTRRIILGVAIVAVAIGWYAFRPELLFVDRTVNEVLPQMPHAADAMTTGSAPHALATGEFHGLAHATSGVATIHQLGEGKQILRLTSFVTSNGPDVHVYLVGAEVDKGTQAVRQAGFIDLGSLKGNKGDQNYDLPAGIDLAKYKIVSIWCARFAVNFGVAPLSTVQAG